MINKKLSLVERIRAHLERLRIATEEIDAALEDIEDEELTKSEPEERAMNSRQDREFLLYLGEAVSWLFPSQGGASELRASKFDKRLQSYREWCEQNRDISLSPAQRKKREIENRDREEEREAQERETGRMTTEEET